VRNLAQRSAAAAKEIKTLIGDSVDKVSAGTKLVDAAGKTMQEIVTRSQGQRPDRRDRRRQPGAESRGIEQVNTANRDRWDRWCSSRTPRLVEEATRGTPNR
jgi:methyl-accepting chemotaxis protein